MWGARLRPSSEDYFHHTLGPPVAEKGGAGTVFKLLPQSLPPLVAKLYNDDMLPRIRGDKNFSDRLIALALHRDELARDLPFATWPRRLLLSQKQPANVQAVLLGFTMEQLSGSVSLRDLIYEPSARLKLKPTDTAYLGISLADQVAKLHRHPWTFILGDMSLKNFHVSADLKQMRIIDTDGFQFEYNGSHSFRLSGLTDGFKSPEAAASKTLGRLTTTHDDYVLAILLFMMLMADKGAPTHPFQCSDMSEDENIKRKQFPLSDTGRFPLPKPVVEAWRSLPQTLQDAFVRTFTGAVPIPAAQWVTLLSDYRRLL